jgi:hypothetical protein
MRQLLLNTKQAAAYLGVPVNALNNWRAHGLIPGVTLPAPVHHGTRYNVRDLDAFVTRLTAVDKFTEEIVAPMTDAAEEVEQALRGVREAMEKLHAARILAHHMVRAMKKAIKQGTRETTETSDAEPD